MSARSALVTAATALMVAGCTPSALVSVPASAESGSSAPSISATPTGPWPAPASNPGATWDPVSGLTLIFGGDTSSGVGNELWGWDGNRWQLLDDGHGVAPSPRDDAQLVADRRRGVVVLHGGRTDVGSQRTVHSDTWEWDGSAWLERIPDGSADAPPPRLHPVADWDRDSERVILAGGVEVVGDSDLTDTWAWDGAAWEQIGTAFPDPNAIPSRMAYDPSSESLTILAIDLGRQTANGTYVTDLWRWDGVAWMARDVIGPDISPVQFIVPTEEGLLLFDGGTLQGASSTWSWDGSAWTRLAAAGPPPRNGPSVVRDEARNRIVVFSGWNDAGLLDDLWEWDGSVWVKSDRD